MSKKEIRKRTLSFRKSLSESLNASKSILVSMNLMDFFYKEGFSEKVDTILCFYPMQREIDVRPFYADLLSDSKYLYFPVTNKDMSMDFFMVHSIDEENFVKGMKNIKEPADLQNPFDMEIHREKAVFVVTPGLAFAKDGGRIGFGGGCYDRYFERLDRAGISYIKVGVSFKEQVYLSSIDFELDGFDKRLDYVITDDEDMRWIKCQK